METKITLYMGLNDKVTKTQKIDTLEAYKIVTEYITSITDGCTIYSAKGVYKHTSGEVVIENTLRIEIFGVSEKQVTDIINTLKKLFNQESIIKQVEHVDTQFC